MNYVNAVLNWIEAHPTFTAVILLPAIGAIVSWLGKPRTPEEFARMPWALAQALRLWSAIFPDPVKAFKVIAQALRRAPPPLPVTVPDDVPTTPLPKDPPSDPGASSGVLLALLFVATAALTTLDGCAGATDAEKARAAEATYSGELAKCASTEPSREASHACRDRVNQRWGVSLDGGAE